MNFSKTYFYVWLGHVIHIFKILETVKLRDKIYIYICALKYVISKELVFICKLLFNYID